MNLKIDDVYKTSKNAFLRIPVFLLIRVNFKYG